MMKCIRRKMLLLKRAEFLRTRWGCHCFVHLTPTFNASTQPTPSTQRMGQQQETVSIDYNQLLEQFRQEVMRKTGWRVNIRRLFKSRNRQDLKELLKDMLIRTSTTDAVLEEFNERNAHRIGYRIERLIITEGKERSRTALKMLAFTTAKASTGVLLLSFVLYLLWQRLVSPEHNPILKQPAISVDELEELLRRREVQTIYHYPFIKNKAVAILKPGAQLDGALDDEEISLVSNAGLHVDLDERFRFDPSKFPQHIREVEHRLGIGQAVPILQPLDRYLNDLLFVVLLSVFFVIYRRQMQRLETGVFFRVIPQKKKFYG